MHKRYENVRGRAIILTQGFLQDAAAKTAHGLIRGSARFETIAVIDHKWSSHDAGELLDGVHRNIPVYASVGQAVAETPEVKYAVIGIATPGGVLPPELLDTVRTCIEAGLSIVNGLHDHLANHTDIVSLAKKHEVELIDIRRVKRYDEYRFWTPRVFDINIPIIAVMGTDCAIGKRTTCGAIHESCVKSGISSEMIYTGQTGWMQGYRYGFILDTTLNDFVSSELCHSVLDAYQDTTPEVILLEGQAALRNPSGPCGAEYLISANARHVILVHEDKEFYHDEPTWGRIHSLSSEIELIRAYGSQVIGICLNTKNVSPDRKSVV